MARVISASRFWVSPERLAQITELWIKSQRIQTSLKGCLSVTVWKDLDLTDRYAFVVEFESEDAWKEAIPAIVASGIVEQITRAIETTPDIDQIRVDSQDGADLSTSSVGDLMSTSVRRSDPGLGVDIKLETKEIFNSLKFLPGYMGALYGANVNLNEEIYGFVLWSDRAGFEASLPAKSIYEVKLFERIL